MSTSDPTTNAIAERPQLPPDKPPPPAVPGYMMDEGPPAYWTNIPADTPQGKALILKCYGEPDARSEEVLNTVWPTCWLHAHLIEITDDKTGEVMDRVRTTMLQEDGKTLSFVSMGIVRSLKVLVALYGRGPWVPPLPLKVRQVQTRGGNRTFMLEVDTVSPNVSKPKGK